MAETKRKVTRVRDGIEGDKKLQDNEDLVYDRATGSYYAVQRAKKNQDAADGKTRLTTDDKKY